MTKFLTSVQCTRMQCHGLVEVNDFKGFQEGFT